MTYVLSCDRTFRETGLRLAGKDAALLHAVALHECASVDGDGVLTPLMVKDAANLYDLRPAKLAAALVAQNVWHDAAGLEACGDCIERTPTLDAGSFLIHRWWEPLLHSSGKDDAVKRQREQRRKRLNRDKPLVAAIRHRDRDLCRYCGVDTLDSSGPDRRSPDVRTLDHVDPWGGNTLTNIVVACRRCNGYKNERTPEQWLAAAGPWSPQNPGGARTLLKPGTRSGSDPADPAANPEPNPATGPGSRAPARETGPSRIGTGRDGSGTGPQAGTGPGREPALSSPPLSDGSSPDGCA